MNTAQINLTLAHLIDTTRIQSFGKCICRPYADGQSFGERTFNVNVQQRGAAQNKTIWQIEFAVPVGYNILFGLRSHAGKRDTR